MYLKRQYDLGLRLRNESIGLGCFINMINDQLGDTDYVIGNLNTKNADVKTRSLSLLVLTRCPFKPVGMFGAAKTNDGLCSG